jgi:DNA-binding Lrp family transcriptional regulator
LRYGLILVKIGAARPIEVLEEIRKIRGVMEAYPVFGRFDLAVFIEGEDYYKLKDVAADVAGVKGIKSTETLVHGD